MKEVTVIAASSIAVALLIAATSIPLILRKVPMNRLYGVRFRASFQSEQNWYAINESGGKVLLLSSIPILLCGLYGVIFPVPNRDLYVWVNFAVTMLSAFGAFVFSLKKAKELERNTRREG